MDNQYKIKSNRESGDGRYDISLFPREGRYPGIIMELKWKKDLKATPTTNTIILAIGWVLASFMGTTGAAMLLIRLLLATIQQRKHKVHTVLFFIAIVANCGGLLSPLGDPPLFLLFQKGTPFLWWMQNILPEWFV